MDKLEILKFNKKMFKDKKQSFLKQLVYDETKNIHQVKCILKDALYYKVAPKIILDYINRYEEYIVEELKVKKHVAQISSVVDELKSYSQYKYLIIGGAMMEHITIYEKSHKDAWSVVSGLINDKNGNILTALCYELNGDTTRSFEGLEKMFKEPIQHQVRGAVVKDFLPNYSYIPCNCRENKIKRILDEKSN